MVAAAASLFAPSAEASELRFSETAAGQVVATGNTLANPFQPLAFGHDERLDAQRFRGGAHPPPGADANPWPSGTTNDWTLNGSEAELILPQGADVLYAELVWGGSTLDGSEDVSLFLDDPVILEANGDFELVSPAGITALDISEVAFSGFLASDYLRSADVTDFVRLNGPGTYSTSGVPATQSAGFNSLNAAGWTLLVAYRDSSEPIRNLTIFVGGTSSTRTAKRTTTSRGFVHHLRARSRAELRSQRSKAMPTWRETAFRSRSRRRGRSSPSRAPTTPWTISFARS